MAAGSLVLAAAVHRHVDLEGRQLLIDKLRADLD
jgi:hypothetical protein